jgi:hypothetical protein
MLPACQSPPAARPRIAGWLWPAIAALVSLIPVLPGFSGTHIFYVRDLSSYFWPRYLWLRREWLAGRWPLWDPHVGAGQSAYVDALHQMFFPPAMLVRLLGNEALGFNLWILAPFPLAAIGAWLFFARRTSRAAACVGAIAFAVCGPVVSSGDFPNLSWSVASIPWVLWATDRLIDAPRSARAGVLALAVACQSLAGEPVTLFITLATALAWSAVMSGEKADADRRTIAARVGVAGGAIAIGIAVAAVQLLPMIAASALAERGSTIVADAWSLRPTALLETVWLHLFGNYYDAASITELPWMPILFTGREPLLFSIYFGVPVLALAVYGLASDAPRRVRLFWVAAGLVSLVGAFGSYTPIYPVLRDHVPPFDSFRFPVKYIYVATLALAQGVALGCDRLRAVGDQGGRPENVRRRRRAMAVSLAFAVTTGAAVAAFAAACLWLPAATTSAVHGFASLLGDTTDKPAAFMLRTAPRGTLPVMAVAAAAALLLAVGARHRRARVRQACACLLALLAVADLVVHARGINPVMDADLLGEPAWIARAAADTNSRFYVGGKQDGTLDPMDIDASRAFEAVPGLRPSESRARLSVQAAFYPSAWGARELLSYDLPVLWPRLFDTMAKRFAKASADERDRFMDRMAIRFRVLPQRRAGAHRPLMPIPQFYESFLYDFADQAGQRVFIVPAVKVMPDADAQIDALFAPGWDSRAVALVTRDAPPAGAVGPPRPAHAAVVDDAANRTVVDADVDAGGEWLVLLDSYAEDWHASVDGQPAEIARANGLFRAVHLTQGRHSIAFVYRPRALRIGGTISAVALVVVSMLLVGSALPATRTRRTTHAI